MKQLLLAFLLAFSLHVEAFDIQGLIGTWQSKDIEVPTDEPGQKLHSNYRLTFASDSTVVMVSNLKITIDLGRKIFVDAYASVKATGTYTLKGDTLKLDIDRNTGDVNLSEDDVLVRGLIHDQVKQRELRHQVYIGLLEPMSQYLTRSRMSTTFIILDLQKKKFTCFEGATLLNFKRK